MPWMAETPLIRPSFPSVFKLPRWIAIPARPTTKRRDLHQCMCKPLVDLGLSLTFQKGTTLVGNVDFAGMVEGRLCNHSYITWVRPSDGDAVFASHPPLRDTEMYVHEPLRGGKVASKKSEWLTGATAYYPAELTWQLVGRLTAEACKWYLAHRENVADP